MYKRTFFHTGKVRFIFNIKLPISSIKNIDN